MQEVEIRAQVDRILRSDLFENAPVLQRALSYMVGQVLEGRAAEIKEIILALEVFNRGSDFDPRTDSSVRTQIGRLRQRLQSYYDGPGQGDAIVVTIPKGRCAPVFSSRGEAGTSVHRRDTSRRYLWVLSAGVLVALAWLGWMYWSRFRTEQVLSVAVLPFLDLTAEHNYDFFAEGVAEEIIDALVQNQSLRVIARTSSFQYRGKDRDIRGIGQELNVEAVIEGSVRREGDSLRISWFAPAMSRTFGRRRSICRRVTCSRYSARFPRLWHAGSMLPEPRDLACIRWTRIRTACFSRHDTCSMPPHPRRSCWQHPKRIRR